MTDEEIEVVAEELAKSGGLSWYPGRTQEPHMRLVTDHYREQVRAMIAALDHLRTGGESSRSPVPGTVGLPEGVNRGLAREVRPGATIIYRPPGDQRAYPCRIVAIEGDRAYLAPILRTCVGWVSIERFQPQTDKQVTDH